MRISDWSSDVCSSDLGASPRFVDHFETNQLCNEAAASGLGIALCLPMVAERFIESRRLIACAPLRLPVGVAYQVHTLGATPAPGSTARIVKIGRASCRERVWQYV